MALLTELKKQVMSKNTNELIDVLCKPDDELRFSKLVDASSMAQAGILKTKYAGDVAVQAKLVRRLITPILLERIGPAELLNDVGIAEAVDYEGMLRRVSYLYDQMQQMNQRMEDVKKKMEERAPRLGIAPAKSIEAFGLGGSASGPLLAREIIQNHGFNVPLDIHTGYPERFHGIDSETLAIICSFSGKTEEMIYAFNYAAKRTKNILLISRGGKLGALREEYPLIEIPETDIIKPRESIGYWLTAFLSIVSWTGLAKKDDGSPYGFKMSDVENIKGSLHELDTLYRQEKPFDKNPAKKYATYFLYGTQSGEPSSQIDWQHPRLPVVFLNGADRAIGKRLINQFGESVEHPIELVMLAEDAHNEIESVATLMLKEKLQAKGGSRSYILVSSRPYDSPGASDGEIRAAQRMETTLETLFNEHDVDFLTIEEKDGSLLKRKLCLLKLLDYIRAYACILLGTPPLPTIFMDLMKKRMQEKWGPPALTP